MYGQIAIQLLKFFLLKIAKWQCARTFQNFKKIIFFECEWPNGNLNDLCMDELLFGHSLSNSNTNGN